MSNKSDIRSYNNDDDGNAKFRTCQCSLCAEEETL